MPSSSSSSSAMMINLSEFLKLFDHRSRIYPSGVVCNTKSLHKNEAEFGIPVCLSSMHFLFDRSPPKTVIKIYSRYNYEPIELNVYLLLSAPAHIHEAYFIVSWRFVVNVVCSTCGSRPISQMFPRGSGTSVGR